MVLIISILSSHHEDVSSHREAVSYKLRLSSSWTEDDTMVVEGRTLVTRVFVINGGP
jgi:hypothetical protein